MIFLLNQFIGDITNYLINDLFYNSFILICYLFK